MQVKLLRVIQEKRVRKVGATVEEPVDVRIISATHQNLAEASRVAVKLRLHWPDFGLRFCRSPNRRVVALV